MNYTIEHISKTVQSLCRQQLTTQEQIVTLRHIVDVLIDVEAMREAKDNQARETNRRITYRRRRCGKKGYR